jgi:ribosomal-protein-alanine N-acetyltransferase
MRALKSKSGTKVNTSALIVAAGRHVILRLPTLRDRAEWIALRRANWTYLRHSEPTPKLGTDPCGSTAFARLLRGAATERSRRFLVCSRATRQIMGQISFSDISRGCFQSCFVGYWMGRDYKGRGYMTEALSLAVRYAFSRLALHRLEANIAPSNVASRVVAAQCGFRFEGRARRLLHLAGRWRDHERWAITADS